MPTPTIKGMFVMSHVRALRVQHGEDAVRALEQQLGKKIAYNTFEKVSVRDEVAILEHIIDITAPGTPPQERSYQAGRLNFQNFITTPFAKIIFSQFRGSFKMLMMRSAQIAGHVFEDVQFSSEDLGPTAVVVVMKNNDYPLDHFRGLFQAWMEYAKLTGKVTARQQDGNIYEYTMSWK